MRKRKKPILLVTLLVCSLGAIAAMNYKPSAQPPEPAQTPETGQDVHTKSKEEIAADVKKLSAGATPAAAPPMHSATADGPEGGPKNGPPLSTAPIGLKPQMKPYKPTFNESATSTQWYTDETPKEVPKAPAPSTTKVRPGR